MSQRSDSRAVRIDQFFAGLGARGDEWRSLAELAEAWRDGTANRAQFEVELAEMTPTEEFPAYPGLHLLAAALRVPCSPVPTGSASTIGTPTRRAKPRPP